MGALALTSVMAAPLSAQDAVADANRQDAQCLALFLTAFGGDDTGMDDDAKMGGTVLIGFYLGKLEARAPGTDLQVLLTDVIMQDFEDTTKMDGIAERCGAEAMTMADRMIKVGESMGGPAE